MEDERYHCFWMNPYGSHQMHEVFDDLGPVLELVKKSEAPKDDYSDVRGLVVIYGSRLEFEPAVVVQTYKVKE